MNESVWMAGRLPPLSVLRAFAAVVRHGGVTRAADALHLTPGAISRAVRDLELDLGRPLFARVSRGLTITPVATRLAEEIEDGLAKLASALTRARAEPETAMPIVLSCEPTFLIRWLIPRLEGLQAALGENHELRLVSAGGPVAFRRDGIDLAIRRADFTINSDTRAAPFLAERVGPVIAPATTAARCAGDAVTGVLLANATRPDGWSQWAHSTGVALAPTREVRFEHFYQSLQAAVAGTGAAIGPIALVADDLLSGTLIAPYGLMPDGSHYVLMASREAQPAAFDRALAWLTETVAPLARIETGVVSS